MNKRIDYITIVHIFALVNQSDTKVNITLTKVNTKYTLIG